MTMDTPTQKPTKPNPAYLDAIVERIAWFLVEREVKRFMAERDAKREAALQKKLKKARRTAAVRTPTK